MFIDLCLGIGIFGHSSRLVFGDGYIWSFKQQATDW